MLSLFRRRSGFARALARYGFHRCSVSAGGQLWVGLPPNPEYRRGPVEALPDNLEAICFVEGPEQAELVAAFAAGPECRRIRFLMIGTSHDYRSPEGAGPLDISAAVAALRHASLPALTRLSLGDMEKLFNGHVYYGRVGDITHVFDIAPALTELTVCGNALLDRPVSHQRLETLHLRVDDIGVSGGPLSQTTVDNLVTSRFPSLHTLELVLDEDQAEPYGIPQAFFSDNGFPALEHFGMDRLKPDVEPRLRAWAAERKLDWTL